MSRDHVRLAVGVAAVVLVTMVAVSGTYRVVSHFALQRFAASPPLSLSAAMAGLFVGGIVAVLGIVALARWR